MSRRKKQDDNSRVHRFTPNSYTHLRQAVEGRQGGKKHIKRPSFRKPTFHKPKVSKKILLIVLAPFVFLVISLGVFVVARSDIFVIKSVRFESTDQEKSRLVQEEFIGKNIFSFGHRRVAEIVNENFDYVTEIYLRKEYPDTLSIEVVQDKPDHDVYFVDSVSAGVEVEGDTELENRVLTLNQSGKVLESSEYFPIVTFTPLEIRALLDEKELDGEEIRGIYKSRLETEEERDAFEWEEVEREEKEAIFNEFAERAYIKLDEFYNYFEELDEFPRLVQIMGRFTEKGGQADRLGKYRFTLDVIKILEEEEYASEIPIWLTPTTLRVDLKDGRRLFLSSGRPFEDQLRDLKVIFVNNIINTGKIFDLRTSNFSVSN